MVQVIVVYRYNEVAKRPSELEQIVTPDALDVLQALLHLLHGHLVKRGDLQIRLIGIGSAQGLHTVYQEEQLAHELELLGEGANLEASHFLPQVSQLQEDVDVVEQPEYEIHYSTHDGKKSSIGVISFSQYQLDPLDFEYALGESED